MEPNHLLLKSQANSNEAEKQIAFLRSKTESKFAATVMKIDETIAAKEECEEYVTLRNVRDKPSDKREDLHAEDADDPMMAAEYAIEIFDYLRQLKDSTQLNANYMEHQEHLTWEMRDILVNWLVHVFRRFRLLHETLFLAINILDRFLSEKLVQLPRLQLAGIAAILIASKYEERCPRDIDDYCHVANDTYTKPQIISAERYVLSTLNYELSYANPMNFLRRISKADDYDIQTRTFAKCLMEINLLDHRCIKYRPSQIAAAAMYLARRVLGRGEWV
ncbi:hypothetical protein IFR05_015108 [Cadophora sp. M221]|nr:hypothetical protein IFR05_015108 [Cadophora sp. M221]